MDANERKKVEQGKRLRSARLAAGFRSARAAALENLWAESTYRAHEAGKRTIGPDDAELYGRAFRVHGASITASQILFGDKGMSADSIPVMGRVGAGAEIEPDVEQVPPEGLYEIQAEIPLPPDMIGFEVVGDSMYPRYDEGDVVVCRREGGGPRDGDEAAVRTADGRRYLKRVIPHLDGFVTLESHNAPPIRNVRLTWFSPVYLTVRRPKWRRLEIAAAAAVPERARAKVKT